MTTFAHLTLTLLLHYPVKCRSRIMAVCNSEFVLDSACVSSENTVRPPDINPVDYTIWNGVCFRRVYRTKILDVNELKRRINSECATRLLNVLLASGRQRVHACVCVGGGHYEYVM